MRRALGAAVVAVLLVSACSSGDDDDAPATSTTAAAGARERGGDGERAAAEACPEPAATREPAPGHVELRDQTEAAGLVGPLVGMYGHAAAASDVDGDGNLDLFVGTFSDRPLERYLERGATERAPDRLLLGDGAGGFAVDDEFDLGPGRSSGAVFADLDDDGDPDLVVARNRPERGGDDDGDGDPLRDEARAAGTVVLRNDAGRFEVASEPVPDLGARAIAVLDHDGDGLLDLFVAEDRFTGGSSVLLRNEGDLEFRDATADAGLPLDVHGLGAVAADLSGDGHPDLFVGGSNRLFVNDGDGSFHEAGGAVFAWDVYGDEDDVAGIAVGDLDRDGRADLVVGHHYNSTTDFGCEVPVRVYLNRGGDDDPEFEDVTEASGVTALPTKAPHVDLVDLDNDGWLDIVASASAGDGTLPAVMVGTGLDGGVPTFAGVEGLGDERYWITGVSSDVDGDGRVDVFMVDPDPARPSVLWRNESDGGHWLAVQADVGAVVEVVVGDEQLGRAEVLAGSGNASGGPPVVHFGLGDVTEVDVVVTSRAGDETTQRDVAVDQVVCPGCASS